MTVGTTGGCGSLSPRPACRSPPPTYRSARSWSDAAGEVVGRGHNVREAEGDPTGHAEVRALRGRRRGGGRVAADRLHPGGHPRALHDVRGRAGAGPGGPAGLRRRGPQGRGGRVAVGRRARPSAQPPARGRVAECWPRSPASCCSPFSGASETSGNLCGGGVSERPKEHASKACDGASHPWVQIPPPPPTVGDIPAGQQACGVSPKCAPDASGHRNGHGSSREWATPGRRSPVRLPERPRSPACPSIPPPPTVDDVPQVSSLWDVADGGRDRPASTCDSWSARARRRRTTWPAHFGWRVGVAAVSAMVLAACSAETSTAPQASGRTSGTLSASAAGIESARPRIELPVERDDTVEGLLDVDGSPGIWKPVQAPHWMDEADPELGVRNLKQVIAVAN